MRGRENFGFRQRNYWIWLPQLRGLRWGGFHGCGAVVHHLLIGDVELLGEDRGILERSQSLQSPGALRLCAEGELHVGLEPMGPEVVDGALCEPVEERVERVCLGECHPLREPHIAGVHFIAGTDDFFAQAFHVEAVPETFFGRESLRQRGLKFRRREVAGEVPFSSGVQIEHAVLELGIDLGFVHGCGRFSVGFLTDSRERIRFWTHGVMACATRATRARRPLHAGELHVLHVLHTG